ncbi:MAG TPA: hypothetical protein PLX89_03430 [Verrucomicrobiota bacterium]|nr:hypothetical protein [Verrucomicrobiales bacterium]HRI12035.1 hypothetical protein [Verrucomicrobiota bacterium]
MIQHEPKVRTFPLLPGIFLGALLGAVGLTLFPRFLNLLFAASSGDWSGLVRALILGLKDAFTTPWGAIGALIGGTLAWKQLRAQPEPNPPSGDSPGVESASNNSIWVKSWRVLPWKKLQPGEGMLAWGLAFLAITLALTHFVMGFFLAVWPAPIALTLLALGVTRVVGGSSNSGRKAAGTALLLLGFFALAVVAYHACALSYKIALHALRPAYATQSLGGSFSEWGRFLGSCLIPVLLIGPGLWLGTDWSRGRRVGWCVVVLLFPVMVLLVHQILAALGGPLTA